MTPMTQALSCDNTHFWVIVQVAATGSNNVGVGFASLSNAQVGRYCSCWTKQDLELKMELVIFLSEIVLVALYQQVLAISWY